MVDAEHRIAADHPMFAGHFPGDPIVPGAYLLAWVVAAADRALAADGDARRVVAVARVKFLRPLRPDEAFRCAWRDGGDTLRFDVGTGAGAVAQGTLRLQLKEPR